ncbi:MAG: response regulator transcription factor, partial [Spirochaetes bacterium]|nr:response regulator transcription factor [Spirochaetota bacterium]
MKTKNRIAIIDDELNVSKTITIALEDAGYAVDHYESASDAHQIIADRLPDLIILDILMPGIDGITFCSLFRKKHPQIPILFLSSKTDELTKIEALERGGDDYLTKPFSLNELLTRVKVCLRRIEMYQNISARPEKPRHQITEFPPFLINYTTWEVTANGKKVCFTVTEFRIFTALISNPDMVFTREKLMEKAYPE